MDARGEFTDDDAPTPAHAEPATSGDLRGPVLVATLTGLVLMAVWATILISKHHASEPLGWAIGIYGALVFAALIFWGVAPKEALSGVVGGSSGSIGGLTFLFTVPFWYSYAHSVRTPPHPDFYSATSQIIPLLLLAVVIDLRRHNSESFEIMATVFIAALGEFAALFAVSFDWGIRPTNFAVVCSSIFGLFCALVASLIGQEADL